MPSLKEVKNRINSVTSTRKITSAMKLVASSKLHRAQAAIESMLPYQQQLGGIMTRFVAQMQGEINSPYVDRRKDENVVIVVYASNSSLCGAFNANVMKELQRVVSDLRSQGVASIEVETIGVKAAEKARKLGFTIADNHASLLDHPSYAEASRLAQVLLDRFANKEIDRVILIYNHFKNTATQILTTEDLLPLNLDTLAGTSPTGPQPDYLVEPSASAIVDELIPKVLLLKVYTALLDSLASEHSARVMAMQVATDNADELLEQLKLMYNKQRQAAITAELLDIVGASFQ